MPDSDSPGSPDGRDAGEEPPAGEMDELTDSRLQAALQAAFAAGGPKLPPGPLRWVPPTVEEMQNLLPQYDVQRFVAKGGMGAVYQGAQRSLQRVVAVKILPPGIDDGDMQFASRFKQEAQSMAQLSHPHIVAVYDAGETRDGLLYFVMEFIEGTDVGQLIATSGRLDPRHALAVTAAVCDALAFAHEEGVIHRDIKPSNVMLDKRARVKVADFGLAKVTNIETSVLTGTSTAIGSAHFTAPEVLAGSSAVDHRADLYAVGVMLYQMLVGQIPQGRFDLPSLLVPGLDPRVDLIVDKAMKTNRENRYSTAGEMRQAVEEVVRDFVSPKASGGTARKPLRGWGFAAAVVAVMMLVLGAVLLMKNPAHKSEAAPVAEASTVTAGSGRKGVWMPVKLTPEYAAGHRCVVTPEGVLKTTHGIALPDIVARNVAVRARVKRPATVEHSGLQVREDGPRHCALRFGIHDTKMDTSPGVPGQPVPLMPHPMDLGTDSPVLLELAAVGGRAFGKVGDTILPVAPCTEPSSSGYVLLWSADGEFTDIEVMILDGVPEAEAVRLAGFDSDGLLGEASYPQPAQWTDGTAGFRQRYLGKGIEEEAGWLRAPVAQLCVVGEGRLQASPIVRVRFSHGAMISLRRTENTGARYTAMIHENRARLFLAASPVVFLTPEIQMDVGYSFMSEHEAVFAAQGPELSLWIDGRQVAVAHDERLTTGSLAVQMDAGEPRRTCLLKKVEYGELPGATSGK